ncbi:MAG: APC family permease [Trueperaceae bacterium]|nr:APC family permease [Trueperaceae bacterium]
MTDKNQTNRRSDKMGFNATWSMAVGGMVGGGIFSVLGVVIAVAGSWAWLSFVVAGLIALATGYSYARLADRFGEGGGAFIFLREMHYERVGGGLSWVLILGYVLTLSVYAFTFGHYLSHVLGTGDWLARFAALAVVVVLMYVNLLGVGESASIEVITVWGKLIILLGLAAFGLWRWQSAQLTVGLEPPSPLGAIVGAASVFMAYEGFQLLTYDYDDIRQPRRTLPRAIITAIVTVIAVYVAVALGATMLVGADTIVAQKEIALAVAGEAALGTLGLVLVTIAAALSTGSAINATLFATARLTHEVAADGELPSVLAHRNERGVPDRAIVGLGVIGGVLAMFGALATLVEAASLAFLITFAIVNTLAISQFKRCRWTAVVGALGASAAALILAWRLAHNAPWVLGGLFVFSLVAMFGRPLLLRRTRHGRNDSDRADDGSST